MAVTHLITGFGLDKRALECLNLPDRFRCHDLTAVERNESLPHYALRLAEKIGFQPGDTVGGLSFGGMLALEIARQCGAAEILLMSSCTHPRFIRPFFHKLGKVSPWIPKYALQLLFQNTSRYLKLRGMHNSQNSIFVREMMGSFPPDLIRKLPQLILEWEGCEPKVPCRALHCEEDWVIQPPLHLPGLTLLPGKNHLITVTQADAARNFLMR